LEIRKDLCQTDIVIFVLAGVVDYRADIQTLHPRVSRAVVEQTEIGPIPWQRAGQVNPGGITSPAIPNRFVSGEI
jgi:hypothetical protein